MEEELEDLKKQVLMLNVAMAVVMRVLKSKGLIDLNKVIEQASQEESKQSSPDKEAGYNQILEDFQPKIKN